jgi:hypothetical protein
MADDQVFKQFLREFPRDFLRLFFPKVESRLDFRELQFLETESFTSFPDGSSRTADVVARVRDIKGKQKVLLVHVEVEAKRRSIFAKRMFQYYCLLWAKHGVSIFPVVVYLRGGRAGVEEEEYVEKLFGQEQLRFRYSAVALKRLEAQEYVENPSPVAPALAALICRRRVRDPARLWLMTMERLKRSGLDEARTFLLLHIVNTHFVLRDAERDKIERAFSQERYREVREMQMTWAEKVEKKGRAEGMLEGRREALLRLTTKFGPLPEEITSKVRAIQSLAELDLCLDRVLVATSLRDMDLED